MIHSCMCLIEASKSGTIGMRLMPGATCIGAPKSRTYFGDRAPWPCSDTWQVPADSHHREAIGVGLPHGVASDRLELGVHDHHRDVEVVADEVRAAQPQPSVAFVAHVGVVEVHHELSDLERRAGAEVDLQQVAVEGVGERMDRVHVGAEPARRL